MLQRMKDDSRRRRQLLAQQLGVNNAQDLSHALGNETDLELRRRKSSKRQAIEKRISHQVHVTDKDPEHHLPSSASSSDHVYGSSHHQHRSLRSANVERPETSGSTTPSLQNPRHSTMQDPKIITKDACGESAVSSLSVNSGAYTAPGLHHTSTVINPLVITSETANELASSSCGHNPTGQSSTTVERLYLQDLSADPYVFVFEDPQATLSKFIDKDHLPANDEPLHTYTDSSTFLKGTQSANPHNDYCQHFVDTGHRPQNFIRDCGLTDRFEEYPKLKELIKLKDDLISQTASPPMYLKCDLHQFELKELKSQFDIILIEPPLEEYQRSCGVTNMQFWSWDEIMSLEIEEIASQRSFVFLWCGSSDGLDLGRKCLRKWGFRRCEDICWIKTNNRNPGHSKNLEPKAIFQRTKEHCLMGIKGTVRRSTDGDFIHANCDIDLIISEQPDYGSIEKPEEIVHIIEHFCLGKRRLHVFGRDSNIRPGWLTIGSGLTNSNFNAETYQSYFEGINGNLTGCSERIEALRPKSPPPKNSKNQMPSQMLGKPRNTRLASTASR